jgi:hypothetical protein
MAKIKSTGDAVSLVSDLKLEDIRLLAKHRPKALALYDGDNVTFRVSTGDKGSVSKFGVCFASATRDEAGLAVHTPMMPAEVKDAKEFAVEEIGVAVLQLKSVETQAKTALAEVKAELQQVREAIVIA